NEPGDWTDANQQALVAALDRVRRLVEAHAAQGATQPAPDGDNPASDHPAGPFALDMLVGLLGLSSFCRDGVRLFAGVDVDPRAAAAVGAAHGRPDLHDPTFALALAALPGAHWSALAPGAPLRGWRLVELRGAGLTSAPLRLDERILHFLTGINQLDERLYGLVTSVAHRGDGGAAHDDLAVRLVAPLPHNGARAPEARHAVPARATPA